MLEYHLGLLDGAVIADEIKQVRPEVPIVMLIDHLELPDGALKSVDALVAKSDGPHFLLATIHFILNVKPAQRRERELRAQMPAHLRRPGRSREGADRTDEKGVRLFREEFGEAFGMEPSNSDRTYHFGSAHDCHPFQHLIEIAAVRNPRRSILTSCFRISVP